MSGLWKGPSEGSSRRGEGPTQTDPREMCVMVKEYRPKWCYHLHRSNYICVVTSSNVVRVNTAMLAYA